MSSFSSSTFATGVPGAAAGGVTPVGTATFSGDAGAARAAGELDADLDLPDQPPPSVETKVAQATGPEGATVLGGGGAGVVEGELGGAGSGLEQGGVAEVRAAQGDVRGAKFAAGEAGFSATTAPTSGLARAENLEAGQRDRIMAETQAADDAHTEARRVADDPTGAGMEQAELAASEKAAAAVPIAGGTRAKAEVVTGAVADPEAAARARAEGLAAEQEHEAEVKIGIRGPEGPSHEEIAGSPPTGDDEKK